MFTTILITTGQIMLFLIFLSVILVISFMLLTIVVGGITTWLAKDITRTSDKDYKRNKK